MIKIECQCADSLPLDDLIEFQGNLKKRTKADIEKIKNLIIKYGFSFPFFVWKSKGKNYTLDGHGRIKALKELRETEKTFPKAFPVVYVNAKSEIEAKQKLLGLNSQYGRMSAKSVREFTLGEIELTEFILPSGELRFKNEEIKNGSIPFTPVLGEENNYIVLKFETDIDFINACTVLNIKTVKALSTRKDTDNTDKFCKAGIGRVIDGVEALERMGGE